ncbi:MAG TPA: NAD(P)-dependent oxidoreductase [Candidatus Thermoplasmatota archaeon]|nr:NAD(P)-dependent oxidoreductase [Candidatus Thermoplasmatota archaeon]
MAGINLWYYLFYLFGIMDCDKENVVLFGASGTMGFEAFKELWSRKEDYKIVILVRPSQKNKQLFKPFEKEAGLSSISGKGIVENDDVKIVWGDATIYEDVLSAVNGADWVLDAMACISPFADYYPEIAEKVNVDGIRHIVRAIESQPDGAEHIKLVYTGTVAETGDRLGTIHYGRVGDPLKPSIFDSYAITKIAGERIVLESRITHWVSLRLTYIMPTDYQDFMSLVDPIMFHQPINSFMENITSRDAGFGLVNCLRIGDESDFWRRVYNMGGGERMRCTAFEFMNMVYQLLGLSGIEACAERKWFALRNFHMQYFEDSHMLNEYLNFWRDSLTNWKQALYKNLPVSLKIAAFLSKKIPFFRKKIEQMTYDILSNLANNHKNGTMYWYHHQNHQRISAFYKSIDVLESIPDWGVDMPQLHPEPSWKRLNHGYDEQKEELDLTDLKKAAAFRGGICVSKKWNGDLYEEIRWKCAQNHEFTAKPYTVLKAGHWCPTCAPPPWDYDREAKRNPFFAQVWYLNHDKDESNFYPADCIKDIAHADKDEAAQKKGLIGF